jgi:hypothetical protein
MISNRQLDKIAKEIVNIGSKFVDIQYKIEHCVPPVPHLFVKGISQCKVSVFVNYVVQEKSKNTKWII